MAQRDRGEEKEEGVYVERKKRENEKKLLWHRETGERNKRKGFT